MHSKSGSRPSFAALSGTGLRERPANRKVSPMVMLATRPKDAGVRVLTSSSTSENFQRGTHPFYRLRITFCPLPLQSEFLIPQYPQPKKDPSDTSSFALMPRSLRSPVQAPGILYFPVSLGPRETHSIQI